MTRGPEDDDGWEKEEATDFDDYLEDLGPDESKPDSRMGRSPIWPMARLREVLGPSPAD